jgi:triphosphoribosyl-dephospho-CoA synthetase
MQRAAMLNGVGMDNAEQKKIQLIKRLTSKGYNLQVMACNGLQEFLVDERRREEADKLEYERQQKEKKRILGRIMDSNVRMMGSGFRQSFQWMQDAREAERQLIFRQRGVMNRMVDSNVRLMSAGFNKLVEEWKARQAEAKEKLRFILKSLTDIDARYILCAYNGLVQRCAMLNGVGMDNSQQKKIQLIKRLTSKGYNLQVMACNGLQEFLASERRAEEAARLEHERQQKEKDRILRRIMDSNVRMMAAGFRQSLQWMQARREEEIALMRKQRGIMNRMVDANTRLMSAGFNKLVEEWKARQAEVKEKLRFILKSLTDIDARYILCAYNGLVQRCAMLNGVGMDNSQQKKIQLIKRLTSQGYNLQVMACNGLQDFLVSERAREDAERLEHERQQKEKDRILRRIMDANIRMQGAGFRQALQWMEARREEEIALMRKQRGIMRRIVDSNTRLAGMGFNK